jgi:hypothetical protein
VGKLLTLSSFPTDHCKTTTRRDATRLDVSSIHFKLSFEFKFKFFNCANHCSALSLRDHLGVIYPDTKGSESQQPAANSQLERLNLTGIFNALFIELEVFSHYSLFLEPKLRQLISANIFFSESSSRSPLIRSIAQP